MFPSNLHLPNQKSDGLVRAIPGDVQGHGVLPSIQVDSTSQIHSLLFLMPTIRAELTPIRRESILGVLWISMRVRRSFSGTAVEVFDLI
jgi:hypothetical protein